MRDIKKETILRILKKYNITNYFYSRIDGNIIVKMNFDITIFEILKKHFKLSLVSNIEDHTLETYDNTQTGTDFEDKVIILHIYDFISDYWIIEKNKLDRIDKIKKIQKKCQKFL